jgi:hypothetical protein
MRYFRGNSRQELFSLMTIPRRSRPRHIVSPDGRYRSGPARLLTLSFATTVIIGAKSARQLRDNVGE